jgi:hypothetical protein
MPADRLRPSLFEGVPLTPRALHALRRLVAACLSANPTAALTASLREQCSCVPPEEWLAMIRRHRLVPLLQGNPVAAELMASLAVALQQLVRQERAAALALAQFTCEIAGHCQRLGLPVLVIKGIPLSLQTTGSISGRGRSADLDLWVDPRRLQTAIGVLQNLGFVRKWGEAPLHMGGLRGRYCRWIGYELSLQRNHQVIDLHWALSSAWGDLPSFSQAWQRRESIVLHGHSIYTLSRSDALSHACAHAFKDQWRSLRDLIDIDRLAGQLTVEAVRLLARSRSIQLSVSVAHDLTGSESLAACSLKPHTQRYENVCAEAWAAQLRSQPVFLREPDEPWSLRNKISNARRMVGQSAGAMDWVRSFLSALLPPRLFNDLQTGRDYGLGGAMLRSIQRFTPSLWKRRAPGSLAASSSLPASSK